MAQININNLSFYYEGSYDNIFENVTLNLDSDWKLGLVGRNGRGKTTFLHLLMGAHEYTGEISSPMWFQYFPLEVKHPEKNALEIAQELYPAHEEWKLYRELNLMGMDTELLFRPFHTLSGGEQTRVILAMMFMEDHFFLLIDEPTNHLDREGRIMVQEYLKKKKGFILVSHDRHFLDGCIDHVMSINKTNIEITKGDFSTWWENKENRDKFEINENQRLKKDMQGISDSIDRNRLWAGKIEEKKIGNHVADRGFFGAQSARMMKRALSNEKRLQHAMEEKGNLLKNIEGREELKIHPLKHFKKELVHLEDLSLFYGDQQICHHISFDIIQGDRVILQGENGSGKSSIIKKILGEDIVHTGKIEKASGLIISYISQSTDHLKGSLEEHCLRYDIDESLFKTILRKLDFQRTQFEKNMEDYSNGQKKKVLIATSLSQKAHLYIWDEPLNYIDIFSRMQIEDLLERYQPTMLLVEHDSFFTEKIGTKLVELKKLKK